MIAIRRHREWKIDPDDKEKIQKDDVLIARGTPHGIDELKAVASGKLKIMDE